jgi:hypothetical protein
MQVLLCQLGKATPVSVPGVPDMAWTSDQYEGSIGRMPPTCGAAGRESDTLPAATAASHVEASPLSCPMLGQR